MTPEQILKKLLEDHLYPSPYGLIWAYNEGTTLQDVDPALAKEVEEFCKLYSIHQGKDEESHPFSDDFPPNP